MNRKALSKMASVFIVFMMIATSFAVVVSYDGGENPDGSVKDTPYVSTVSAAGESYTWSGKTVTINGTNFTSEIVINNNTTLKIGIKVSNGYTIGSPNLSVSYNSTNITHVVNAGDGNYDRFITFSKNKTYSANLTVTLAILSQPH